MGLRVKECGKSESLAVMVKIGLALAIVTLVHAKAGRLPQGHNYEKDYRTLKKRKQMITKVGALINKPTAWKDINWKKCYRNVQRLQSHIVKAT